MVAKIKSGKSLKGALNYNEHKVKQGRAELIEAAGYLKDSRNLSFYEKLLRLTDLAARNERTKTNTVHISLNFPNGENLPVETLKSITQDYMQGIGFGNQPYLVYRHQDAGHPHIHIVTTNIKKNGERISLHYLGQNQSEKARKAIEIKYKLVKAEEQQKQKPALKAEPADYGKQETKRAITNVVNQVIRTYKFTSIPELNAVLRPYHIEADPGSRDSRIYAKGGLVYWVTDKQGNKAGVPVKASSIYGKPTLKTLEEKFRLNETLRKPLKDKLKITLVKALQNATDRASFEKALEADNIEVLFRRSEDGRIYGATFIDHYNKAVFKGSDLGKEFSANPLNERFNKAEPTYFQTNQDNSTSVDLLDILLAPDQEDIGALNKIKRESRKKRKGLNL
ncbi:relaxase/mobilization nuclease domain-containing protein [Mucilaginibacter segetis]|uniref:Relaxase/mobilization nuclease domain-containing protein n=1 Tax=Mucilaginibacter segetis TaxID=2793071 RepID=A0A934UM28_9SPHI|nr:relaxase/mobilization nuclease domain-containing protein [Mucilaginibacter segetis]MBK0379208.1 relaxase/mobilization nuclease domain-containing protein [Mucilaginibacter segetis]